MSGNGKAEEKPLSFSIVKQHGDPNEATTVDGHRVYREEKILIPELGGTVRCAPYSSHFVYLDPANKEGRWFAMCTCGAPAVIVGYDAYKQDASSNEGALLVCLYHAKNGFHQNEQGSSWK